MIQFCRNCGMENEDGARFCQGCGAPIMSEPGQGQVDRQPYGQNARNQSWNDPAQGQYDTAPTPVRPAAKKPRKGLWIGIGAAAAAVIVILLLVMNMKKTLNLSDYLEVSFSGPDGYVSASASLQQEQLALDAAEAMGYDLNEMSALGLAYGSAGDLGDLLTQSYGLLNRYPNLMQDVQEIEDLLENLSVEIDKSENLSNGDRVTVTAKYTGFKGNGKLKIRDGEKAFDVTDRPAVQEIDPFANIRLTFAGVEPYGTAILEGEDAYAQYGFSYSMEPYADLSVGDQVTVTVDYNEASLLYQGYHVTADTKTYTVDRLDDAAGTDLFANVGLQYEGTAPFVTASLVNRGTGFIGSEGEGLYIKYEIDGKSENLDVGDTVTVKAYFDREEFTRGGLAPLSDTKEFTVTGVDRYLRDAAELEKSTLEAMKKESQDKLESYLAGIDRDDFRHSGEVYAGNYILTRKPTYDSWSAVDNCILLLYKGTVKSTNENSRTNKAQEVVYAFEIDDVIELADGTQSFDAGSLQMIAVGNEDFYLGWNNLDAYSSMEAAFNDLVVKNKDGYTYTESMDGKEKSAGAAEEAEETASDKDDAKPTTKPKATEKPTATPKPAEESAGTQEQSEKVYVYCAASDYLTLRDIASRSGKELARIPYNAKMEYLGLEGEFTFVSYNGQNGYVLTEFVSSSPDPAKNYGSGSKETENTASGTLYCCASEYATLRSSASRSASEIAKIYSREAVTFISSVDEFYYVEYNGNKGYVLQSYFSWDPNAPLNYGSR